MTVQELYDWAVENNCENFNIITDSSSGNVLNKEDLYVDIINDWLYI